ncbi:MAG TPA: hypothetical protein VIL23_02230, partial [Clostridia bacterium]
VMTCLIRQASGCFTLENAKTLQELEDNFTITPCKDVLSDFDKCVIENQRNYFLAVNGAQFRAKSLSNGSDNLTFYYNNELIGIGQKTKDNLYKLKVRLD